MDGSFLICLIGGDVMRNLELIEQLSGRHGVVLLPRLALTDASVVRLADVVVVDCGDGEPASTCALVKELGRLTSGAIVVMDGGLAQDEVAGLLSAGARDYFSEPFNVALIKERLEHLAEDAGTRR